MKLVSLDVGTKRIGVATADTAVKLAVPYGVVTVDGSEFGRIAQILREEGAEHVVVGLPRNGAGAETAQSAMVRSFAMALRDYLKKQGDKVPKLKFQDESLTSVMAEENLDWGRGKKKRSKGDVDKEAATLILQDFLDSFREETSSEKPEIETSGELPGKKRGWLKVLAVVIGVLVMVVVGGIVWYGEMLKAPDVANCDTVDQCNQVEFVVLEGESVDGVTNRLEKQGLIKSRLAFWAFTKLEQRDLRVMAGVYELNNGMTAREVAAALNEGSEQKNFVLELASGASLTAVRDRLVAVGYDRATVNAVFTEETLLFANRYEIGVATTVEEVKELVVVRLDATMRSNMMDVRLEELELSMEEAVREAAGGEAGVAVDIYDLAEVTYADSKIPFVVSGDYRGWKEVYGALAKKVGAKYGIPYEAILAQSILESSWGKSKLAFRYCNFFGIKYVNMPNDPAVAPSGSVRMGTWEEYKPGEITETAADFATWDSVEKGFAAYAAWVRAQSRYAYALQFPKDAIRYITELKNAGYATDSNYVKTLTGIIESLRKS